MLERRIRMSIAVFVVVFVAAQTVGASQETSAAATSSATAPSPAQLPAWMSVDVVKTAVAINMTDAQQHAFNEAVGEYVGNRFAAIQTEAKRESPDIDQRVKSRDNALVHKLDDRMRVILTKAQWPAYEDYRKALRVSLKSTPLPSSSNWTRTPPGIGGGQG